MLICVLRKKLSTADHSKEIFKNSIKYYIIMKKFKTNL